MSYWKIVRWPHGEALQTLGKRRGVMHQVAEAEGPERIAPEWWRRTAEAERDYYTIEDTAGRRFWLFRHGLYGHSPSSPQ